MKKILALLVVMLFTAAANADMLIPKIGYDFQGKNKLAGSGSLGVDVERDAEAGYSIGLDYLHPSGDMFAWGIGAEYQMNRKIKDTSAEFGFLPIYVTGMLAPFQNKSGNDLMKNFLPYARVNLGYNVLYSGNSDYKLLNSTLNGGFYWAAGVGAKLPYNLLIEALYSSYAGQHSVDIPFAGSIKTDDTYTKVGVNIGYAFDLNLNK